MTSESVRVAVRVRPFNDREHERGAKSIIEMVGKSTKIVHPTDPQNVKTFNFDYSYWSHDGFKKTSDGLFVPDDPGSAYASQQRVFEELGQDVLRNALEGYNCCLFAYGQTGSGKSYSMVGFEKNKGIVPITCNELFKIIDLNSGNATKYAVSLSMLEIYNERVRDLLNKSSKNLEVRQSEKQGFYVQDLEKIPVGSYVEIEKRMNQGTANRTIAATQMNATSSRAHTVITVEFKQVISSGTTVNTRSSTINLIDLAGSERADSTGATGDRLREGANINKSLSALGNVIAALADSSGGKKNVLVPYRDSILTKMLKNALGGNSKTLMIAALSPADINYDETLSTLRYADRAKRIKNVALVNENPLEKLIRELRDENEKMKKMLSSLDTRNMTEEEIERYKNEVRKELAADNREKSEMLELYDMTSWQENVKRSEVENISEDASSAEKKKQEYPYLSNLNEDPQLSGVLLHFVGNAEVLIGKSPSGNAPIIKISGPGVQNTHAMITFDSSKKIVSILPCSTDSTMRVNGASITATVILNDLDRVLLGSSNLYIFHNPLIPSNASIATDWESAQMEMAAADGFKSEELTALESQIIEILPLVNEVNAISVEMKKNKTLQVLIISQAAQAPLYGEDAQPKVVVKITDSINRNSWLWERSQFISRRYIIQEMYQRFLDGDQQEPVLLENDPFWEPTADIIVGHCSTILSNLAYNVGMESLLPIMDYKARQEGELVVNIAPSDKDGVMADDDSIIEDANELLGKPLYIKISIINSKLYKARFIHGSTVSFRFYRDSETYTTPTVKDTLEPQFNHSVIIKLPSVTKDHLKYFQHGSLTFCVYGTQKDEMIIVPRNRNIYKESEMKMQAEFELRRRATEERILKILYDQQSKKINKLKQICTEWAAKSPDEQQFDPFYRSIVSLAFNTGKKFKVVADLVGKTNVLGKFIKNKKGDQGTSSGLQRANIVISRKGNETDGSEACVTM